MNEIAGRARVGTAGWSVPKPHAATFPAEGSHLARYAQVFSAVEINSAFYRHHKPATFERWAASTVCGQSSTGDHHLRRLVGAQAPLVDFLRTRRRPATSAARS